MKVFPNRNLRNRTICLVVFALMVAICAASGAYAAEDDIGIQPNVNRVTIKEKRVDAVTTNTGRDYDVTEATIILNEDGEQIPIRKLMVPCQAEVTWDAERGKKKAKRIAVLRTGSKQTWQWGAKTPE